MPHPFGTVPRDRYAELAYNVFARHLVVGFEDTTELAAFIRTMPDRDKPGVRLVRRDSTQPFSPDNIVFVDPHTTLTPREYQTWVLREVDGLTWSQVRLALGGVSEGCATSLYRKAVAKLLRSCDL